MYILIDNPPLNIKQHSYAKRYYDSYNGTSLHKTEKNILAVNINYANS